MLNIILDSPRIPRSRKTLRLLSNYIKNSSGLIAYYPLDETEGAVAFNRAPETLGSLNGSISGAELGVEGLVGTAFSFDGNNDVIEIANTDILDITGEITISALVKPDASLNAENGILSKTMYNAILNADGKARFELEAGGYTNFLSDQTLAADTWYLVVMTYDSENMRTYINGVEDANSPTAETDAITTNSDALKIGLHATGYFKGDMQHIALFDRAFTAAEVVRAAQIVGLG